MPTLKWIFNVSDGEGRGVLFFCLINLLWSVAASIGVKLGEVLFIAERGADALPNAYLATAAVLFGARWITRPESVAPPADGG